MKYCPCCCSTFEDFAGFCGVCGQPLLYAPPPPPPPPPPATKEDRMALAGFVLSLMGLLFSITTPLQLAALILSFASGNPPRRKGFRIAGIVISIVSLVISGFYWYSILSDPTFFSGGMIY